MGANITVIDNLEPKSGGNTFNLNEIKDKITIDFGSILEFGSLAKVVSKADIIINCAASTSHSRSMNEPFFDLDVNIKGVLNILECIKRFNKKSKFIHLGTTTQMGVLRHMPADENHSEFPTDIYSTNKSVSEKYVLIYANAYDLDCSVLRLSNTYGPRASIHSPEFTFNNYFVGQCLKGQTISIYGEGKQKRSLIYIDDAINAIVKAIGAPKIKGETVIIGSDKIISVAKIAETMVEVYGRGEVKLIPWPKMKKKVEVGDQIFNTAKAKQLLGWEPKVDLRQGLTETFNFFQKNLEHYI